MFAAKDRDTMQMSSKLGEGNGREQKEIPDELRAHTLPASREKEAVRHGEGVYHPASQSLSVAWIEIPSKETCSAYPCRSGEQ